MVSLCLKRSDKMLKIDFTNQELENIKSKIHFTELQQRIIKYRQDELTIIEMAFLENVSESTINREIKKIKKKIMKII